MRMPSWTDSFLPGRATGHMITGVQRVKKKKKEKKYLQLKEGFVADVALEMGLKKGVGFRHLGVS